MHGQPYLATWIVLSIILVLRHSIVAYCRYGSFTPLPCRTCSRDIPDGIIRYCESTSAGRKLDLGANANREQL